MNPRRQHHQDASGNGNPSTPARSQMSSKASSRPLPPWPVSPTSPESPKDNNHSPVCPGAPFKNRYPGRRYDDDADYEESMLRRGIRPIRLNFEDAATSKDNNNNNNNNNNNTSEKDKYLTPLKPPNYPSPTSNHNIASSPMLGFRPRHRKPSPPKDMVPIHHNFHIGEISTPQRHSHSSLDTGISSDSSSTDRYGETARISRGSSRENSVKGDSDSEWQR